MIPGIPVAETQASQTDLPQAKLSLREFCSSKRDVAENSRSVEYDAMSLC
jgi:hypothetical protein